MNIKLLTASSLIALSGCYLEGESIENAQTLCANNGGVEGITIHLTNERTNVVCNNGAVFRATQWARGEGPT